MLRPASLGGPAPRTLFPPPVKVNLAVRRGITVPSRLPPAPPPRRRSHRSIERSQLPIESAHDVSEARDLCIAHSRGGFDSTPSSDTTTESDTWLGYRRSFKHVRGLNPRTQPTSALPQISTMSVPTNTRPEGSDDATIVAGSEGSLIRSISEPSSDESEPPITWPDDAVPNITINWKKKGL